MLQKAERGESPTQIADKQNRAQLDKDITSQQHELNDYQAEFDDLARKAYRGDHSIETWDRIHELTDVLAPTKRKLGELEGVRQALENGEDTYLMHYEPNGHRMVHAAISVGNPDVARNVSTTIPGVSTTPNSLSRMVGEAATLRLEADEQREAAGLPAESAAIAWLGYDPPPNPLDTHSPKDAWNTLTKDRAVEGAPRLADFLGGIRENNPGVELALFGHSYGSLTASLALQELKDRKTDASAQVVDRVAFYGSPGLAINKVEELGVPPNAAFIMKAKGDLVVTLFAPFAPDHGWGRDPYRIDGIHELSTGESTDPHGQWHPEATGHSEYPQALGPPDDQRLTTAGYNLATILAGLPGWLAWKD
ncbi:MAG: alpha/beta hydrolase [Gordonia sp. (in: high G+C Gram-positive bacteria)]